MCVNCAAQGSSYVIGAVAAGRALTGSLRLRLFGRRPGRLPAARSRPRPPVHDRAPRREWPTYALAMASYIVLGVLSPRLLDPVLGPLYLVVAIYVVPRQLRRLRTRLRPLPAHRPRRARSCMCTAHTAVASSLPRTRVLRATTVRREPTDSRA